MKKESVTILMVVLTILSLCVGCISLGLALAAAH
jgi:hypothetical protein